jgi:Ca-activated chloride channel family protein
MTTHFQHFTFQYPYFFILLLALPLLWQWLKKKNSDVSSLKFNNLNALRSLQSPKQRLYKRVFPMLNGLIFLFIVVALARPQLPQKEEMIKQEGIDIMLALDLSMSMLAKDFKPDRLEASKNVAISFVQKRPYDRIGLVVFSGEAFSQCPLTTDHEIIKQQINALKTGVLADGTAIGMGLATAVNRLKESNAKSKVIILLTDGVNNSGYISPTTAAELAKELGIKIYTIGVGTIGNALMPIGRKMDGEIVFDVQPVEIDENLLMQLAQTTEGGAYFRAKDAEELKNIYNEINLLEKTTIESSSFKQKDELFRPFLLLACFLLLLNFILKNTYFRILP